MENVIYIISMVLSAAILAFFFFRKGKPYRVDLWLFVRGSIYWAIVGAIIYIALEFIFLK